jgi:stress-induced morphogen
MPISQSSLETLIKSRFPEASIQLIDLIGDEDHYELRIFDKELLGISKVAQHKLINQTLIGILGTKLHALTIKVLTDKP